MITQASAPIQVAVETLNTVFGQVRKLYAFSIRPINDMLRRSDVPAGGYFGIALMTELLSEPFK